MKALAAALAVVALGACKTRGTIDIQFDGLDTCGPDVVNAIVYAERDLRCTQCEACGACFGSPGGVTGCPDSSDGLCDPSLSDVDLDLSPGHWVVVVALLAPDPDGLREVGSACVDIDVDADGVASREASDAITCEADCDPL